MEDRGLREALQATGECLPIEILSVRLSLASEDQGRRSAEAHLEGCLHCRTEVDLLREFESGVINPDEAEAVRWISARLDKKHIAQTGGTSKRLWWRPNRWVGLGYAAALGLVAVVTVSQLAPRHAQRRPLPDFQEDRMRSGSIDIIQTPGAFTWRPIGGATDYELSARLVDGTVVFHKIVTKQTWAFPAEVAKPVSAGKLLLWEVVARDSQGNQIASSGIQKLKQ